MSILPGAECVEEIEETLSGLSEIVLMSLHHDGICAPRDAQLAGIVGKTKERSWCLKGGNGESLIIFIIII